MLLNGTSNQGLFTLIHDKNLWNEQESVSGPGSTFENTKNIRAALPEVFETYGINSILDIHCGDFNWIQHVEMNGIDYTGADIVEKLIDKNNRQFASGYRSSQFLDLVKEPLPKADLILCRDGLVHFYNREIKRSMMNILHITRSLNTSPEYGVPKSLVPLIAGLTEKGHKVEFIDRGIIETIQLNSWESWLIKKVPHVVEIELSGRKNCLAKCWGKLKKKNC